MNTLLPVGLASVVGSLRRWTPVYLTSKMALGCFGNSCRLYPSCHLVSVPDSSIFCILEVAENTDRASLGTSWMDKLFYFRTDRHIYLVAVVACWTPAKFIINISNRNVYPNR